MVSPSKAQQQEQEQPPRKNNARETDRRSYIRIQKGPKPLEKKTFYLDIKNHALSAKLEAKIKDLGGGIEVFLARTVTFVISDRVNKSGQASSDKRKWSWVSGGSGGPPSLRSIEVPTPTPTPPTPSPAAESPLANSTNLWGLASRPKSRADAMLERALTQPQQCSVDPLKNAQNWGIPIWATDKLQAWLDKIYASLKDTNNLKQANHISSGKDPRVKHLKAPYIKFESFRRDTRPVYLELPLWPTLNFDGDPGSCPFDRKRREKKENRDVNKEIKESKQDTGVQLQDKSKEMTRRPRGGVTRARRTDQLVAGHCEICRIDYRDLSKHVRSDQHLSFVRNDDNFLSLDSLINAGASVEAFLKLNGAKDIGKDCNLFPPGDNKVDNTNSGLDNFGVDETINMVQCNGARRKLNLKLSSPHNLRTRTKHESGHSLRSKGTPWHEVEKSDKFYDKFEGFTIKKRSKGTIWIEENDPDEKCIDGDDFKEHKVPAFQETETARNLDEAHCKDKEIECQQNDSQRDVKDVHGQNCLKTSQCSLDDRRSRNKSNRDPNEDQVNGSAEHKLNGSDTELNEDQKIPKGHKISIEADPNRGFKSRKSPITTGKSDAESPKHENTPNPSVEETKDIQKGFKTSNVDEKAEKITPSRVSRRGGRTSRGRNRLSVEERLIEDNRAYYKVEVLGNKLRSSAVPTSNSPSLMEKDADEDAKKDDAPSSEKPVVVRFKRVRKSELSLLSDEAESFMFGEPKRNDSSDDSEDEQSSVLPKDTESEYEMKTDSVLLDSTVNSSSPVKQEIIEEDSQDSVSLGRARKRRRTQAEALIKDNADYYKFETPGSRLRYQAPMTGIKEPVNYEGVEKDSELSPDPKVDGEENLYPSKPSPEVEKMQFSFEAVPKSEPWYQTYQRQDEGAEFWHCFSEGETQKPFLLPYEIDNFYETLMRGINRNENGRKRGRGRGGGSAGRLPRKSPRCHASTLAIMSTIIRKREQQLQLPNLSVIEEESLSTRSQLAMPKPDPKLDPKSDVDEDLNQMAKNIDDMLCGRNFLDLDDSFETELSELADPNQVDANVPKGPPPNLLELLDNCQDVNCLDNSSCASSECGDGTSAESPLKRRKRRKNRTGWPGIKIRKKLNSKALTDGDCERENVPDEKIEDRLHESAISERLGKGITELTTNGLSQADVQESRKNTEPCISRRNRSSENSDRIPLKVEEELHSSHANDENHENLLRKDGNATIAARKQLNSSNAVSKKRPRRSTLSSETQDDDDVNRDSLCAKDAAPKIVSRKQSITSLSRKRQRRCTMSSETRESTLTDENHENSCRKDTATSRKQQNCRKGHQRKDADFEDEHCRKDTYLTSRKQQSLRKRQQRDTVSSEARDVECTLQASERVSPSAVTSTELEHRRSSIEYQPVVRMMKIDEQVEMDNGVLSVTVASNRRLRSSSSPRSSIQQPSKRFGSTKGQFGRWIKNS